MTDMAEGEFRWFVGIDWATATHQVCVLDAAGAIISERAVDHTVPALTGLLDALTRMTDGALHEVAVGIEVPRGGVVETLMERGAAVFTINPKQVDRFRDRFSVAGAKDDRRDARVIAGSLRTDRTAYRRITAEEPQIIQLRELARADEDLAHDFNRLTNRLREQVYRVAPDLLKLSPAAVDPWFWALLELVPSPKQARAVKRRAVDQLLQTHRIRRVNTDQILDVLSQPALRVAEGTHEATQRHIALLLPRLRLVHEQRRMCAKELEALLNTMADDPPPGTDGMAEVGPSDVAIARSLPGVGRMVTATLFAEAATLIAQRNHDALRALGGLAPVTKQSGSRRQVCMRHACNHRLRDAFYHWARTSAMFDPRAKARYASLRARGHSHGRALRSVADHALRILIAMLKTKTLFDPSLHAAPPNVVPA